MKDEINESGDPLALKAIITLLITVSAVAFIGVCIFLSGCSSFMARSYYQVDYTFVTPTTSTRDEIVTGKVGGEGLTHSRVMVEFPRAFKLLIEELRGSKKK